MLDEIKELSIPSPRLHRFMIDIMITADAGDQEAIFYFNEEQVASQIKTTCSR
jgi:hypothetical protein